MNTEWCQTWGKVYRPYILIDTYYVFHFQLYSALRQESYTAISANWGFYTRRFLSHALAYFLPTHEAQILMSFRQTERPFLDYRLISREVYLVRSWGRRPIKSVSGGPKERHKLELSVPNDPQADLRQSNVKDALSVVLAISQPKISFVLRTN